MMAISSHSVPQSFGREKELVVLLNEMGVVFPFDEIGGIHDPFQEFDGGFHPGDLVFIKRALHPGDGLLACLPPGDQLGDQRVVIHRDLISFIYISVVPDTQSERYGDVLDHTRAGA